MSYRPRHYPHVHRMFYTLLPYSYDPITEQGNPWDITANLSLNRTKTETYSDKELWQHISEIGPIQKGISDSYVGENFLAPSPGVSYIISASIQLFIFCNPVIANYPYDQGYRTPHKRNFIQEYIPQISVTMDVRAFDMQLAAFPIYTYAKVIYHGIDGAPFLSGTNAVVLKSVLPSIWHPGVKGEDEYVINTSDLTTDVDINENDNTASYVGHPAVAEILSAKSQLLSIVDAWTGQGVYRMAAHQMPRGANRARFRNRDRY